MLKRLFLLSLFILSLHNEALYSHPPDSAKDRGGKTTLTSQYGNVERAGVAIVKDYVSTAIPDLRFAVFVGADAKKTYKTKTGKVIPYVNFFGGGCEVTDKYSTVTAVEELYEETGKGIDIPASSLQKGKNPNYYGYVYSGDFSKPNSKGKNYIQLFFFRMDKASIKAIQSAMDNAAHNTKLSHRFKETNAVYAIPLKDIVKRARLIHQLEVNGQYNQAKDESNYIFLTRGKGDGTNRKEVYLDPQYLRNIARDIARDPNNLSSIVSNITGGLVK